MIHLGDITKIKGYEAPTVDCIVGGSPCQDLSLAGKRAGLAGARSGLYMEQIRIIKEMRENDRNHGRTGVDIRPRYMVWENVPGAFSTNKGQDFAAVLEEAIRVAEPEAPNVRVPEKGWPTSGCFWDELGRWSVAWRVLDAQFWGTSDKPLPQRRRRIALVADFGGLSASEILFVRKSVSGDIEPGEQKGKEAPRDAGEGSGRAVPYTVKIRGGIEGGGKGALVQTDKSATLSTLQDQTLFQPVSYYQWHSHSLDIKEIDNGVSPTIPAAMGMGGTSMTSPMLIQETQPVTYCIEGNGSRPSHKGDGYCESDTMYTLNTTEQHAVAYSLEPGIAAREGGHIYDGVSGTLRAKAGDNQMAVAYTYDARGNGDGAVACTITGGHQSSISDYTAVVVEPKVIETYQKVTGPLMANSHPGSYTGQDAFSDMLVAGPVQQDHIYTLDRETFNCGQNFARNLGISDDGTAPTLVSRGPSAVAHGVDCRNATEYENQTGSLQSSACHNMNSNNVVRVKHIVRRLTPLECERLQGFPDGWTDIGEWVDSKGKKHKEADSPRYKALGNSIALPPWKWVMKRLCACYERDATMASLFDGIGGFPLIWEQINGKGSCLWASEIEEFPIAVTKLRFGGNENGY